MSIVFIVSAPSGSGKSTLVRELLRADDRIEFSISYTTREMRGKEKPGEDYNYISRDEFERAIERSEFLEYAQVFGNYYGTHRRVLEDAQRQGKDLLLDIDVQGARQLKERIPDAVTIFVLPPSRAVLEQRLRSRQEDTEAVIQRRLHDAAKEVEVFREAVDTARQYSLYDYVIVNRRVDEAALQLASIVRAERAVRWRMEVEIAPILESFGKASWEA